MHAGNFLFSLTFVISRGTFVKEKKVSGKSGGNSDNIWILPSILLKSQVQRPWLFKAKLTRIIFSLHQSKDPVQYCATTILQSRKRRHKSYIASINLAMLLALWWCVSTSISWFLLYLTFSYCYNCFWTLTN